jgi:hypothetical protein
MKISEMITELEFLKGKHGDIDVTMWQYNGGGEELCNIDPFFSDKLLTVILNDDGPHESEARR